MEFYVRRLLTLIASLLGISLITFLVFQVIPGDPALLVLGTEADPAALDALRREFGMHLPFHTRYFNWISAAVTGDLGRSIRLGKPVTELLAQRLPVTVSLAAFSILFTVLLSLPLGVMAAVNRGTFKDYGIMLFAQMGIAIPSFWAGILLILLFAVKLRMFSAGGFVPWQENAYLAFKSLVLPSAALGLQRAAILTRMVRSSMLETLSMDYVRTARAKGLPERTVVYKHALKNAMIPVITVLGLHVAGLIAGSIIIEQVFSLPGMGRLMLMAISYRDFPLIQGLVLFVASVVVIMNFVVDMTYTLLDPRIRYS
ncbi:MAG: ABC transporter permease [Bacillota bacterium]